MPFSPMLAAVAKSGILNPGSAQDSNPGSEPDLTPATAALKAFKCHISLGSGPHAPLGSHLVALARAPLLPRDGHVPFLPSDLNPPRPLSCWLLLL